jgi:hypothetical protein
MIMMMIIMLLFLLWVVAVEHVGTGLDPSGPVAGPFLGSPLE